jgi:sodium pump decarboxylase gamma subunit
MNNLLLSLEITALGMGLVFGAIILLWLMMSLLTRFTAEKESASDSTEPASAAPSSSPAVTADLEQAAAIAVAIALAEQDLSSAHPLPDPPTAIVSAWQLGMRTRQMTEKGYSVRH